MHINPLKTDAATVDTVKLGDRIICWEPNKPDTRQEWVLKSDAYADEQDGGTLIVEVEDTNHNLFIEPADAVGLCGNRYTGQWSKIAILNEEAD